MEFIDKIINNLKQNAQDNNIPIILDDTRQILEKIIKENNFSSILEIGTAIGYSGLILLKDSNANLTTIEKNEERFEMAKQTFKQAKMEGRVNQILGDAFDYLKHCTQKFDLIFLDGPKGQYKKYIPFLINLLNTSGFIIADNVLFKGLVLGEERVKHKIRTIVMSLRQFIKFFQNNNSFKTILLSTGDGILIAKKLK